MKFAKKMLVCAVLALQILSLGVFFTSCGSTKNVEPVHVDSVEDFTRRNLSNGIPVIFKQNKGSKIIVFRMIFEGGTSTIDKSVGGIEDLTFELILRGSNKYSYEKIQQLEYEKSFSLTSSSGKDFSTLGFTCIQRDLAEVLEIYADCFKNPALLEADFNQKMKEAALAISSRKANPSGAMSLALSKAAFEGHPYATTSSITEESYNNITYDLVKGIHQSLMNALRMKIVVVGNFSSDFINSLTSELESAFGSIPRKAFTEPIIPKIPLHMGVVRVANAQAGNTGYVSALFKAPSRDAEDYIPFAMATLYLDDLFFANVREKAGAVYSINSGVIGGRELMGVISVYKASEKKELKKIICDAINLFDGNVIARDLEQYKNRYISSIFNSSQTSSGTAATIIASMEYHGSESAYLTRSDLVRAVSAKDVIDAYKKYIEPIAKENAAQWIVVDSEENLDDYNLY